LTVGFGGGEVTGCSRAFAREICGDVGVLPSTGMSLFCPLAWECNVAAELDEEGK
jgi:hypothetical protein